ncbi:MAG: alpha/beta hydrolase [Selenomonadaceae bacterium]|nr:alpha/beta hydrolase [Selenomonadaceae bacterium]
MMTLTSGTTINLEFGNYELTATAKGNAASSIALTDGGITITPNTGDGSLDLTLTGTSSGSLSANIEVLSGSFSLGDGGEITVAAGTELQIKFSDDYIINFKATDKAGGSISLGADGITFAPTSDDGGLQLTVKRGDDTRSASLDVNGSVTYKLDGSISLTKGTVVKNVFDSGNILTITANTDASGSIVLNPDGGLTITPATADALSVKLTMEDDFELNINKIDGSISYDGGIITLYDGTEIYEKNADTGEFSIKTEGGNSTADLSTVGVLSYAPSDGATLTLNYSDYDNYIRLTSGEMKGSATGGYSIEYSFIAGTNVVGSFPKEIALESAGNYTLNGISVTTTKDNVQVVLSGDYDKVSFAADAGITVSATEDKGFRFGIDDDGTITITTTDSGDFGVSSGSITFGDGQATIAEGTTISLTTDERVVTFTANKDISVSSKIEEDIYYLTLDEATADVTIAQDGQTVLAGEMVIDGVFSYSPKTGTFGLTGANSSHGDGNNTSFQFTTEGPTGTYTFKAETNDTTVVFIPSYNDGKFEMNFPNEAKHSMKFTVSKDGQTVFENNVAIDGTIGFDTANQELSLTKDTVLTLTQGENSIEITALGDAGGKLNIVDGGLRFAPNTGDGQLELNFVSSGRKANIDVTGAVIFGEGGKISLENGTEVTFTWDDGTELKLTSTGSTGSIGIDEKGIKITSEDENLTIDLTTATGDQTHLSGIKGTIYYNAGRVSFDDNSTITATTTLGGESILMTLETIGGTGHLDFADNGIIYSADTGAMQITWKKDDVESTFTVNSGSVQIGHGLFQIAKGTDLATDLKDFVPALYFTTSEAGTYTINGQTITTSAANISMTATDDYMTFKTSDDAITYDDMTFAGNGNVSLSTAGVVLGAGVVADGFGKDKMFILAEAGNVTADARIFELTEDVSTGISVTGAEDGFIFSRTNTEESEAQFDDPDPANVGKIFTEEFFLTNDDSYRIQTNLLGLQQIIGVSSPVTVKGNATFDGEPERTVFDVVTETEGVFTVADKDYSISGDDSVAIKVGFEPDKSYVRGFDSLSGTVSGDFTAHEVSINGSASAVRPVEDTLISISADENGFEVSGLDNGAILWVGAKDTYVVNGTTINANAGDYIAGSGDNFAYLLAMSNNTVVTGTESDDYIGNHGTNVTINALGGNDTIMNYGASNVTINGDADNDIIFNVARVNSETGEVTESPDNVLINGGRGNDYIAAEGSNVTITGGAGKDSIAADGDFASINGGAGNDSIEINGDNASIDAGAGSNQIKVSGKNEVILLKGRTTVEGFNTGFGEGSDTIYIKSENDPAGVEFLEDGLTFGNDTASLTLSDVHTTAKVNLFHENRDMLNKGVFIAAGDWYKVEDSDLTVDSGEEVYFVGTAATPKAGVDFSGITGDLNLTMDTAYIDSEEYVPGTTMWINGVYSLKGGAGNTTITGSKLDDTIISGSGNTTIDAGAGNNQIKLSDSSAAVVFNGQTTVEGFKTGFGDGTDTVYIPGGFPGVDFKDGTLTFYDDTNSLTFKEVTTTAQINTYDAANGIAAKQVYIAEDDWYKVTDGEAQYYVGATASKNHGIDFSGVTEDLNVTLNTPDEATDASMWINNIHSIRGGDGNTTITGSDENDTIISGTGKTTINAGDGDDYIINSGAENILRGLGGNDTISNDGDNLSINGGAGSDSIVNNGSNVTINAGDGDDLITNTGDNVLFKYYSTGGNDSIVGFNSTSTLSIADEYSSSISGNDLIVTVGDSKITLVDAATLSSANIETADLNPAESLVESILKRTAAGYPVIAGLFFNPEEITGPEPTNYSAKEDWTITSSDNLELYGVHYTPEKSNDKWVVLVHGYGCMYESMNPFATFYLANNYNVLMIDQRAAGNSEGTWLTMGGAESKDVALWTQEIVRRNSNAKITLHGVSMGSATAMLAASRSDAANVVALVEDCGYTSAMKLFYLLNEAFGIGAPPEVLEAIDGVAEEFSGHYLSEATPINAISSAKMPTLFISGDDDGVVPVSMLSELYDASGAEVKEKFIVAGAGHAQAGLNDPVGYSNAVFRFVAEANGEGWETTNITDNISLGGTKYNDTITNYGNNVTISAVEGDDSITNTSEYSIIDGGEGNDTIINYSPTGILASNGVSINAGADDDTIINEHAYYVTLNGGEGDDKIIVRLGDHTTIDGGEGNDSIIGETVEGESSTWAMGGYANINGGSGDDYINPIFSDSASILGGEGNDTIINEGDDATINGGAGDDVISLQGASLNNDVIKYEAGDGNDIIYGFNETTKLSITADAEYSTVESGDDVIVNVGDNAITIAGGAGLSTINIIDYETPALNITNTTNNTLITGTENNDTIRNSGDDVSISGAAGDDLITSSGDNSSIYGGAGSDNIRNDGASSSIFGAEGDDLLINTADEALVDGGYGNDIITNSGDSVTIRPGGGFDSISNTGDNVLINYTGGNDSIQGFNATSTLSLSSDDYEVVEGSRNIFVFSGESFAVLQGAFLTNDSININDTAYAVEGKVIRLESGGEDVTISRSNVSIVGGTGDDLISLGSGTANNTIEYAGGNDTIYGVNETTRLLISDEYSSIKVGSDVFVTVGNNIITLVDASDVFATDFEEGESFLLTEKGAVTVGNRVFELTERVKNGVTITGTADGFTSGITNKDGSIFVEEFIAKYDDSYTVQIGGDGLHTISGINAGTEVSTSATKDSESVENQFYLVMGDAGSYTLGDLEITATNDGTEILFASDGINFAADAGISYDGKTFSGDGNIELPAFSYQLPAILGASVSATGFEDGESFILAQKGTTTINGRTFELTEDIPDGMTITANDGGYSSSVMTDGAILAEEFSVAGDDNYSVQVSPDGLVKLSGISNNATINANGTYDGQEIEQYFYLDTDTEGAFTIGEKTYSISGDSNVSIEATFNPDKSYASGFASLEGTVSGNFDGDTFYVNGSSDSILINGDDSIDVVGSSDGTKLFGVSGNATLASLGGVSEVHTDTEGVFQFGATENDSVSITVQGDDNVTFELNSAQEIENIADVEGDLIFSETSNTLFINGMGGTFDGEFSSVGAYDNSLYIHDAADGSKFTTGDADKIWLQVLGETFTLNGNELTLTADSDGIWLRDKEIVGLDVGASLQVSEAGTYTANTTELEAKAGDVIVGLEGDDAYIYDADNLLITTKTPNAEIISHFNPNNQTVVGASETTNQNITLNGGDLAIVEETSAPVNITAGDDTVVSQGENVAVNLKGGNTWLFPLGGKMTLEGYDASTGSGFGTTYTDIASAVADGTIDFNDGRLTLGAAKVYMGKSSELMNFFDRDGDLQKVGYASRNDSLDVSNETADLLLVAKKDSTITGGAGDDTISVAGRSFIDAGAGSNWVSMSSDSGRSNIVLNGNTTVEGFNMGWGRGSDTVYINAGDDPSVDFKTGGLTFYDNTDSLTLKDMSDTAKVNLYYEGLNRTRRAVFIAKDDWYAVSNSDLMVGDGAGVNSGSGIYFVGTSATRNHGIDFSGVTRALNISMNTDHNSTTAEFWVNNIHSIVGGAGNTSITGSDKSDTILAGTGRNNIWSGAGNDLMFGNTDEGKQSSTFFHMTGDGRDTIENFDFMDSASDSKSDVVKLGSAITGVSMNGDNVILQTNNNANDSMTLTNAKGKTFNLNDDLIAKVGDSVVAFDGFTNCYAATSSNATLTVGSGMSKVEVWLGDTSLENHGTMFYGNFRELNAAQADGTNILAGNELSNVITGGSGRNSLWGGSGSASDTLVGGTGHNDFFYGAGNGNDAIQGANDGDNIILDGITLDQISRADIYSGSVSINFNDGSLLRVNGTADVTYQLADGSRFSADHSRREWASK